jgi:hypothetical protein
VGEQRFCSSPQPTDLRNVASKAPVAPASCFLFTHFILKETLNDSFLEGVDDARSPIEKELSSAFWDIEDRSPKDWKGFEGVTPGIEHALGTNVSSFRTLIDFETGRLLHITGDVEAAVKLFLGLLKDTSSSSPSLSLPGPIWDRMGWYQPL